MNDDDEESGNPLHDLMKTLVGNKLDRLAQEIFTERVILLATLRKYGYMHDLGRSLLLTQDEINAAMADIKHLMDDESDKKKTIVSGVVTRPGEDNGDGLELTIFTGPVEKIRKVSVAWQDERPDRPKKDEPEPKKKTTKKKK